MTFKAPYNLIRTLFQTNRPPEILHVIPILAVIQSIPIPETIPMQKSRLRARYLHILTFFARAILSFIYWELILPRIGFRSLTRRTRSNRSRDLAARFRAMAIRMGGVMIKVGQFLSSRLDILPPEVTDELSGLQDEVPPEDFEAIRS